MAIGIAALSQQFSRPRRPAAHVPKPAMFRTVPQVPRTPADNENGVNRSYIVPDLSGVVIRAAPQRPIFRTVRPRRQRRRAASLRDHPASGAGPKSNHRAITKRWRRLAHR